MRNTCLVLPLTPLSPLGRETMSEKTCCPNGQQPHCVHSDTAQWRESQLKRCRTGNYCSGRSADALSTALLTQTELSITVREVALTVTGGELWTFGRAQTRAHEVTPQKGEVREGWPNSLLLKTWQYRFNPHPLTQSWPSGGFDDKSDIGLMLMLMLFQSFWSWTTKKASFFLHILSILAMKGAQM